MSKLKNETKGIKEWTGACNRHGGACLSQGPSNALRVSHLQARKLCVNKCSKGKKIETKECTLTILTIQPGIWSEFGPLEVEGQSLKNDARKCCAVTMVLHAGITTDKIKSTNDAVKRIPGYLMR